MCASRRINNNLVKANNNYNLNTTNDTISTTTITDDIHSCPHAETNWHCRHSNKRESFGRVRDSEIDNWFKKQISLQTKPKKFRYCIYVASCTSLMKKIYSTAKINLYRVCLSVCLSLAHLNQFCAVCNDRFEKVNRDRKLEKKDK